MVKPKRRVKILEKTLSSPKTSKQQGRIWKSDLNTYWKQIQYRTRGRGQHLIKKLRGIQKKD